MISRFYEIESKIHISAMEYFFNNTFENLQERCKVTKLLYYIQLTL